MESIFTINNLFTLGMLTLLQAVLGLFILFIVGIMLVTEGGHLAHLHLFNHEIIPMSKATFYFVIGILVLTDIVQKKYQKKLMHRKM